LKKETEHLSFLLSYVKKEKKEETNLFAFLETPFPIKFTSLHFSKVERGTKSYSIEFISAEITFVEPQHYALDQMMQ